MSRIDELREHILEDDGEFKSMNLTLEFEFKAGKDVNCRIEKRCQGSKYYKPPIESEMQCSED